MLNRRDFIKTTLSTGLFVWGGSMFYGCSGVKRSSLSQIENVKKRMPDLSTQAKTILYHASLAPSARNTQPWGVRIERPGMWMIEADVKRRTPRIDPDNRELLLSIGAFAENLSLAAGALGFRTGMKVVAQNPHDKDVIRVTLEKIRPTGFPLQKIKKRRTVKHGHRRRDLTGADIKALTGHMKGHALYFPRESRHASCIAEATVEAYRVQAGRDDVQRELVDWLRLSDRDAIKYRDGLSAEGMEMRGLKGWIVRHFIKAEDFMKPSNRQQGVALMSKLAHEGGGWLVITSPGRSTGDLIECGRRFERMALLARERGIAIHPMTQILEEKSGLDQLTLHHGRDFHAQFILRVGYLERYPEPVSLRRPVEWFVHA